MLPDAPRGFKRAGTRGRLTRKTGLATVSLMERDAVRDLARRLDRIRGLGLPGEVFSGDLARWIEEPVAVEKVIEWWRAFLREREAGEAPDFLQFYLHVPYCTRKCRFCQFDSLPCGDAAALERYVSDLEAEAARFRAALGPVRVACASVGGGTPSLLDAAQWRRVARALFRDFLVLPEGAFFSVEMNPETTTRDKVEALAHAGAGRISLGVQSLSREVLRKAGRARVGPDRVAEAVRAVREGAPGAWLNLDLLAPLQGETAESFRRGASSLLGLDPDSITLYRYQPVTRNGREVAPGALPFDEASRVLVDLAARSGMPEALRTRTSTIVMRRVPAWARDRYEHHPDRPGSLMAFGPYGESHVFGHGVYRTEFAVGGEAGGMPGGGWAYRGATVERGHEARWELARALARNRPVDRAEFASRLGVDPVELAPGVLDFLAAHGGVEVTPTRVAPAWPDPGEAALLAGLVLDDATLDRLAALSRTRRSG